MSTPADPTPLTHVADLRVCRVIPRNSLNSSEGCWEKPLTEKPSHWVVWLPSRGSSWWGKLGRNTRIMSWRSLYHRTTVRKSLQAPTLLDFLWKTVTVQVISYSSATRNIMHRFTAGLKGFIYISEFYPDALIMKHPALTSYPFSFEQHFPDLEHHHVCLRRGF